MNVLTSTEINSWDIYTINEEPITSSALMERAGMAAFKSILHHFPGSKKFIVLCGNGNNGGDGLVVSRLLHEEGKRVEVYLVGNQQKASPDNILNRERLPIPFTLLSSMEKFPLLSGEEILIDALFGIGLNRPAEGIFAACIEKANQSNCKIVSIDSPSGLFTDILDQPMGAAVIHASVTLTFQAPKPAFLVNGGIISCGKLEIIDIGLLPGFFKKRSGYAQFLEEADIQSYYVARPINAEKRDFGHLLMIGGSYGMMGAITMAARAALRCGPGLVSILAPNCGYTILQTSVPEAMVLETSDEMYLEYLFSDHEKYNVLGVGPGIGREKSTHRFLDELVFLDRPLLLDADALNIIAAEKWQQRIPRGSVITPHRREFERLFGKADTETALLHLQKDKAKELGIYIILKGANTRIIFPDGKIFYNSTGNPGMAKAGCGDVLSGMIAGLWCRYHDVEKAVLMGVYIHGLAGDIATKQKHQECMLPTDIIKYLPDAFKCLWP